MEAQAVDGVSPELGVASQVASPGAVTGAGAGR